MFKRHCETMTRSVIAMTVFSSVLLAILLTTCQGQIVFPGQQPPQHANPPHEKAGGSAPHNQQGGQGGSHVSGGAHVQPTPTFTSNVAQLFFPREEKLQKVPCSTVSGVPGLCRLLVQCATFFAEIAVLSRSPCQINSKQAGVCCPTVAHPTQDTNSIVAAPPVPDVAKPNLEPRQINFAVEQSQQQTRQRNEFEQELVFNNIVAETGTPVFLHARLFDPTEEVKEIGDKAKLALGATLNMIKEFGLSKDEAEFGLRKISVANTVIADTCPQEPVCPETKYRSVDGSCNNIKNKNWGKAATALQRIIAADYDDGANSPRLSVSKAPLPHPRIISRNMVVDRDDVYKEFTLLIMQWGQFISHDMTHTPIARGIGNTDITCCTRNGQHLADTNLNIECLPIDLPSDDPFYAQFGRHCMSFIRSMPAVRRKCNFGSREQMNQITAYIDSSNVYGSTQTVVDSLRAGQGGLLRTNSHEGRDLLPGDQRALGCGANRRPLCFKAGDVRVNEQPDLVVLHTLWMRQHNKIAKELARINTGWNDEVIYQEARRIVIAQMQHITYNEYLPIVLGQRFMVSFGLVPLSQGHSNAYRPNIDASINNAFASAAFRYGHTLITSNMQGYSKFGTVERDIKLSHSQFAPFFLYEKGSLDSMLRGLSIQPSQKFDSKFTEEVVNRLFAGNGSFGMDLVALNIQRGRDHGLPSYNEWRKICHLPPATQFNDFTDAMSAENARLVASLYQHVDDVDLYVGGILETPKVGSLLGHTFLCIVGDQFARLKLGDRFYYENGGLASSFSEAQLDQIRKTSLARIICDNSDEIENMQPLAFVQANVANKRGPCQDTSLIPKISLDPWRNEPVWV